MSTYTQIIYQIVFSTKDREQTLLEEDKRKLLYNYIWGILKNKDCHLYQIGGIEDHLHILISLHPTVALATLVKDIKVASSAYIKENNLFPLFKHWQDGYAAFTYSIEAKNQLIQYIKNQIQHHQT
jgi:putative transposase